MLIDEYSKKGSPSPVSKTADYRLKIPPAVNEILQDLANTTCRLYTETIITEQSVQGIDMPWLAQLLPYDWLGLDSVWIGEPAIVSTLTHMQRRFYDFTVDATTFRYKTVPGQITVSYYRKPIAISVADPLSPSPTELAQKIDAISSAVNIVPTGVAGKVLMLDTPTGSVELLNYYEARKASIVVSKPYYGIEVTHDVYGGF